MNAGVGLAGRCAYVGARDDQGVAVVDVSNPAQPLLLRELPARRGSTPREVRASERLGLLVVMYYGIGAPPVFNGLELYTIHDCAEPRLVGVFPLGAPPHEFYLWHDPLQPGRALVYLAMWGPAPQLRVVDITTPSQPRLLLGWEPDNAALRQMPDYQLHSLSLSPDGTRAYLAAHDAGFLVADTSDLALGRPNPTLRLVTPPLQRLDYSPPDQGNTHSAVLVPGRPLIVLTDEVYGACPWGWLRLVDITDPTRPRQVGQYQLRENTPAGCDEATKAGGTYTAHNPLVLDRLAFVSWYSGGLQVVDLTNPAHPRAVGEFRPTPPTVKRETHGLGARKAQLWSSPILRDSLLYVADISGGLYILRYIGPGADELPGWAEGNAN